MAKVEEIEFKMKQLRLELNMIKRRLKHGQKSTNMVKQNEKSNNNQKKKNAIHEIITKSAQQYNWISIQTKNKQMLSFMQSNQRINIWIKKKDMKITIRIQPMEETKKDIDSISLKAELQNINDVILKHQFGNEGQ